MVRAVCAVVCLACILPLSGHAAERLEPGLYEITVRVAMPNLGDAIPAVTHQRCVTATLMASGEAFQVLSNNNPLTTCPRVDLRTEAAVTTFRIVCPGPNKASAMAAFEAADGGFSGRFVMNMGGKNMTMSEAQVARRIGPCP